MRQLGPGDGGTHGPREGEAPPGGAKRCVGRHHPVCVLPLLLALAIAACGPEEPAERPTTEPPAAAAELTEERTPEATSLLGEPLHQPPLPPDRREEFEARLAEARADFERAPDDADALIWLGRRTAYLGRYREAVEIFTEGIRKHPGDARMYRHRGHRHITLRRFEDAIADLERAADLVRGTPDEIEPDGLPNPHGIPTSTLQGNIHYHLALARYLTGDHEGALPAWRRVLEVAHTDDMRAAAADWLYMTLRRLGRDEEAARVIEPFGPDLEILENHAYHRRLLMYRGEIPADSLLRLEDADPERGADPVQVATYGYAVGNWHLYHGDRRRAEEIFRRVLEGPNWAAFGYIAAEAELAASARAEREAERIVERAIARHGGDRFEDVRISFDLRQASFTVIRSGGLFRYERRLDAEDGPILEVMTNDSIYRKVGGIRQPLDEEARRAVETSVNSVVYFALVPYFLGDPAARLRHLGETVVAGEPYHAVQVTFRPEGGGQDWRDRFVYWFHREEGTLDYLAYRYHRDGGGTRFRVARDRREVGGILFQDYENIRYEGIERIESYPRLWERGATEHVSDVVLENVRVEEAPPSGR